jgi:hypothetical protein
MPCAISKALASNCQKCHGSTPSFGAPMPLAQMSDFHKASTSDETQQIYQLAQQRLNDTAKPMPPGGMISAEDKKALNDWLAAGALPSANTESDCDVASAAASVHDAAYFKNGLTPKPGETCYEFKTHGGQTVDDDTPYAVSAGEHYEQFYFNVPWTGNEVITRFGAKYDNLKVLHHWLLFTSSMAAGKVGTHETTIGTTLGDSSQLIAGWAVGGDHVEFPADTGLELTASGILNLQWHFFNQGSTSELDATRVQICAMPRSTIKNVGSLTFLGTENFNGPIGMPAKTTSKFGGTCLNDSGAPITLFGFTPHMHKLGIQMTSVINHTDGTSQNVFDKPFDFNSQITHLLTTPIVLQPGESITSTCTFNNTTNAAVPFGPSSNQEMCYNFTMSYPAHALDNGTLSLIGATNVCW